MAAPENEILITQLDFEDVLKQVKPLEDVVLVTPPLCPLVEGGEFDDLAGGWSVKEHRRLNVALNKCKAAFVMSNSQVSILV